MSLRDSCNKLAFHCKCVSISYMDLIYTRMSVLHYMYVCIYVCMYVCIYVYIYKYK